jgi:hypothetical protein
MFWIIVMHVFMSGEIARYIEELSPLERERERERERENWQKVCRQQEEGFKRFL